MATLSFHAGTEGKMTKKSIGGMRRHTFRTMEGGFKSHGNEDIDVARTKYNIDATWNGLTIEELIEKRIESEYTGKRSLRSDAVLAREIISQASPDVYEGLTIEEKREKAERFTLDSLEWFQREFGAKNVLGYSVHMDETNPHTHFVVMPMTDDGKLAQKDFFKGPKDLKRQHREYRQHMRERGWDFDMENKYESIDGVPLPKYKANAEAVEAKRAEQKTIVEELKETLDVHAAATLMVKDEIYDEVLAEELLEVERRKKQLEAKEDALNAREEQLRRAEDALESSRQFLTDREIRVAAQQNQIQEFARKSRLGAFNVAKRIHKESPMEFKTLSAEQMEGVYQVMKERKGTTRKSVTGKPEPWLMVEHLSEAKRRDKMATKAPAQPAAEKDDGLAR